MKVANLEIENQDLKEKVKRLNTNMKNIKYKDMMESKLNATTETFSKEIKHLEKTLKRYVEDNKRLSMEVSRRQDNNKFETSMVQSTLENEKKLLDSQQRNADLMKEVITLKNKLKKYEERTRGPMQETLNLNYENEVPFMVEESGIQFGGVGGAMNQTKMSRVTNLKYGGAEKTLNISKFLENDISIIDQAGGLNESQLVRFDSLKNDYDSLKEENMALIKQIQFYRSELKNKEDTTSEKKLIQKLKSENLEIRRLADKIQTKNLKLVKEKNELRLKVDDLKRQAAKGGGGGLGDKNRIEDLEFKIQTLEKTNIDLLKELRAAKKIGATKFSDEKYNDLKLKIGFLKEVSKPN